MLKVFKYSFILTASLIIPTLCFAAQFTPKNKTLTGVVTKAYENILVFKTTSAAIYTVQTPQAKFIKKYGADMKFGEIFVGDKVEVKGLVWPDNSILADQVRDLSLYPHSGTLTGKIESLNVSNLSFVMQTSSYGLVAVKTDGFTMFKKNSQGSGLLELELGVSVTVKGLWERDRTQIYAKEVMAKYRLVNIEIEGNLTMFSPSGMTVVANGTVIYGVDITGAKLLNKNGNTVTINSFLGGEIVKVKGKHISGTNKLFASSVQNKTR